MSTEEKIIQFYFDIVSPASYLAWTQLPKLVEDTSAVIDYRPIFLPGLFKAAGSSSPINVPTKGKWLFDDLNRFAKKYDVPFVINKTFPINSLSIMRGLIAWQDKLELKSLGDSFFQAMWVENRDLTDNDIITEIVKNTGIDPQDWWNRINSSEIKQKVFEISDEAHAKGLFGVPTFIVNSQLFWGQDRMTFVRDEILNAS